MNDLIYEKIKLLPLEPGVYVMLDKNGVIIYVGKAKKLKNRVSQYFNNGLKTEKVSAMVLNVADFYYIITPNERDALTLENNLIKKHKPKYNILLKDDKSYPYIKINLKETFPTFTITRRFAKDGSKYFGPFMAGVSVNDVLELIKSAFKIRPCSLKLSNVKPKKECLNYHLGLCLSPCSFKCSKEEYLKEVKRAIDFLSGNDQEIEIVLRKKMQQAVENEEFEKAMQYRDRLNVLKSLKERKITAVSRDISADVISVKSDGLFACINILFVRRGRMLGSKSFSVETLDQTDQERLNSFVIQYYKTTKEYPEEIISLEKLEEETLNYLQDIYGKKVINVNPKQGLKLNLVKMADKNALEYLQKQIGEIKHKNDKTVLAVQRLKEILGLKNYPKRMECYDISHISGVDKVGSMVVFIDGQKDVKEYRRFKIKTVEGNNDFKCLEEVLTRRLLKLNTPEEEKFPRPDLFVIDGGKGQISAVIDVIKKYSPTSDVISLAERDEEIFLPYKKEPIIIPKNDYALRVLQNIRNEAHRFAITYSKNLRGKRNLTSILTQIEGIGKQKRNAILNKFKDLDSLYNATVYEIQQVEGIGENLAKKIKEFINNADKH